MVRSSPILREATIFYLRKIYSIFEAKFFNRIGGISLYHFSNNSLDYLVKSLDNKEHSKIWIIQFRTVDGSI